MADGKYWLSHDAQDIDDTIDEVQAARGSEASLSAKIATKQDTLTFDSAPTADSNNPVTSAGIKAAIDTVSNALDFAMNDPEGTLNQRVFVGTTLANSTDLNSIKNYGAYRCSSYASAGTLYNCPTHFAFSMRVYVAGSGTHRLQEIMEDDVGANLPAVFRRVWNGTEWKDWVKYTGTAVQPINVPTTQNASLQTQGIRPDITIDEPEESEER